MPVSHALWHMEASVHVYEAMYTPQLVQKRKKWYDGVCKFFHANKKLVLIDLESTHRVAETFVVGDAALPEVGTRIRVGNFLVDIGEIQEVRTRQNPRRLPSPPRRRSRPLRDDGPSFDDILGGIQLGAFMSPSKKQRPNEIILSSDPDLEPPAEVSDDDSLLLSSDPESEPTILDVTTLSEPRKSPFESMPSDPPNEGPWTKEAYLLFSFRPPVIKPEIS